MNSAPVTCPRLGRVISSGACCGIICSTPSRQELGLCLSCPVGQRLAMTCPFYTKMHAVPDQGATRPAEAALREVCASSSPVTRRIAASVSSFCLLLPRHSSPGTAAPKIWRGPPATPGLPCASARGASPAMRR